MSSVKKSLAFSFIQNYGITILHFASAIVIARLLTPEEIGVFSVGIAFVAIAHAVRDFGVSNYIVQEKDFTESKKAASIQIAFVVSWSLALLILIFSFLAGNFYDDPRVSKVLSYLSINFFLLPFSSVGLAILRRQMQFDWLCYI
ncbi:MAG: oligosaccharide flippase family protein, partial [Pseudomonadales bacterium]|nr:oligosaccharide flippase family protein [Pseudomonadales bacterium]